MSDEFLRRLAEWKQDAVKFSSQRAKIENSSKSSLTRLASAAEQLRSDSVQFEKAFVGRTVVSEESGQRKSARGNKISRSRSAKGAPTSQSAVTYFSSLKQLNSEMTALDTAREESSNGIDARIKSFRSSLSGLQRKLQGTGGPRLKPSEVQSLLERFEAKIAAFKRTMRTEYTDSTAEERVCTKNVGAMARQISEWEEKEKDFSSDSRAAEAAIRERNERQNRTENRLAMDVSRQAQVGKIDRQLMEMGGTLRWLGHIRTQCVFEGHRRTEYHRTRRLDP